MVNKCINCLAIWLKQLLNIKRIYYPIKVASYLQQAYYEDLKNLNYPLKMVYKKIVILKNLLDSNKAIFYCDECNFKYDDYFSKKSW